MDLGNSDGNWVFTRHLYEGIQISCNVELNIAENDGVEAIFAVLAEKINMRYTIVERFRFEEDENGRQGQPQEK
ncbi:hypothetical protein AUK22_00310 [bacterium CG2_30_54_10]|nr:MAG: hypothetical protein AUK22_00310 [bacterium CG2_30_54_10]